jgi:guanylate kinase
MSAPEGGATDTKRRGDERKREGIALILSAPSGAGKTTIAREVVRRVENTRISVSHTTRAPRPGEVDGRDYHFVTPGEFSRMREAGAFLEAADVHGNWYGTHADEVLPLVSAGGDVILDIDVQGAAIIRKKIDAVLVFILPPSMEELMKRLEVRNSEGRDVIERRMENARRELAEAPSYDYVVVNERLEQAVSDVVSIIAAERLKTARNGALVREFTGANG